MRYALALLLLLAACTPAAATPWPYTPMPSYKAATIAHPTPTPYPEGYRVTVRYADGDMVIYTASSTYRVNDVNESTYTVSFRDGDGNLIVLVLGEGDTVRLGP